MSTRVDLGVRHRAGGIVASALEVMVFSPQITLQRCPVALRHGSKVTSVTLPSRYTFPSVLRTKTRGVEDSVSGSS